MAIYCMQCGKELPNDANFCLKCGKPVRDGGQSTPQPESKWTYCEITWTKAGWLDGACYFWAKGIGPTGISAVAKGTIKFAVGSTILGPGPSRKDGKTVAACDELIEILVSSGWEPLPEHGRDWWSYKFRQQARQKQGN